MHVFSGLLNSVFSVLRQRRIRRICLIFLALAVTLLLSVGASYTKRQLASWNLLPQSQHLTQLSFSNVATLPKRYTPEVQQHVAISIWNGEGRTMTYSYNVVQTTEHADNTYELTTGKVTLAANERRDIMLVIRPTDMGSRSKIVVTLVQPHESISYWSVRNAR